MQVAWKNVFTKTTMELIYPFQGYATYRDVEEYIKVRKLYDHGRRKPCNKAKRVSQLGDILER